MKDFIIQDYISQKYNTEIHNNSIVFEVPMSDIIEVINDLYKNKNLPLKLITATDEQKENGCFKIWYVLGIPKENKFIIPFIKLNGNEKFPSLTPTIHQAWNYERKIKTMFGLTPEGHPDQRPIILHENWPSNIFPLRKNFDFKIRPERVNNKYDFLKVLGEGIYEIPVGPIHAGIIEPGHFRFSVAGEEIIMLEPRLGYVHKGSEKLFEQLSTEKCVLLAERISGDSSFSQSLAFCQAIEKLSNISVSNKTNYIRAILSEMERIANHLGDIGAIMVDTGFNFGGANGSRLREIVMQMNEKLTGSRFLRNVNTIGGYKINIDDVELKNISGKLNELLIDLTEVINVAEKSPSLSNRLKTTGKLSQEIAKDLGVIGVAGKAVGLKNDARLDYHYEFYNKLGFKETITEISGDVYARFKVRIREVFSSVEIIQNAVKNIPSEIKPKNIEIKLNKNSLAIGIVEGWRGDIVYFITTDSNGNINRVDIRDPSFLNWSALPYAGLGNIVPDFPLINKSFNLSYSGNDL